MARVQVLTSDITGDTIPEGEAVQVTLKHGSAVAVLDVARSEVDTLWAYGRVTKARGRRPGTTAPKEPVAATPAV